MNLVLGIIYAGWATPGIDSATQTAGCFVGYVLFTSVAQDYVELTPLLG